MLEELTVRNFALIDSLTLSFERGLTILTGETGAGKSIIVGALGFILGGRADAGVIRTGADETEVCARISVGEGNADVRKWLATREIALDDGDALIVRRNLKRNGRSSIFIQGTPVSRTDLAECMGFLFDLHGQHDHESLLRKETHRIYLDRFGGLEGDAIAFNTVFVDLSEKKKAFDTAAGSREERERRLEYLSFAVDEITAAAVKTGETETLEQEAARLAAFEKLQGLVNAAAAAFFEGERSALSSCKKTRQDLDAASAIDSSLSTLKTRVESLFFEAQDISQELGNYRSALSYDPARLEEVEERLSLLFKLKKKYSAGHEKGESAILAWKTAAEAEMAELSGFQENREALAAEIKALEARIAAQASALSAKRAKAAVKLAAGITAALNNLGMKAARFDVNLAAKEREGSSGSLVCGPWGAETVEFTFCANTGEPLKELARIASGGELSRVMLAIKTALLGGGTLAGNGSAPETLVFDEIDAGIGGEVAVSVGDYLHKIAGLTQVFCITHLATIAVRADNHYKVEKASDGSRTNTGVTMLDAESRRQEIARMLSGDKGTAALAHADELLRRWGSLSKNASPHSELGFGVN